MTSKAKPNSSISFLHNPAIIAFSGPIVFFLHAHFGFDLATFGVRVIVIADEATGIEYSTAEDPISFQWIGPIAFVVNVLTGTVACWWFSRSPTKSQPNR